MSFQEKVNQLFAEHEALITRKNVPVEGGNGIITRYQYPILTAEHAPIFWRYDLDEQSNPYLMERNGVNAVLNSGAIKLNGKYLLVVRVEGNDRKSFFAVAESENGIDNFRFWDYPITMPDDVVPATNIYDMRLTQHEDGWIYGIFCAERHDNSAPAGDLSAATATAGIARTKDLVNWERLPDLKTRSQQRNVVLHPEFVDGKYALYTRPQDGFIDTGSGGGIGWALIDDITHAEVKEETIIEERLYHTIKEVKNGEGPHPFKTSKGWLHLAHGVRNTACGLRYVLYMYMTALDDPTRVIAQPAGYFMAPVGDERIGDVSNVLFANGWIADEDGKVFIYYASSDTRMHVATSTIDKLVDYCMNTPKDGLTTSASVETLKALISKNLAILKKKEKNENTNYAIVSDIAKSNNFGEIDENDKINAFVIVRFQRINEKAPKFSVGLLNDYINYVATFDLSRIYTEQVFYDKNGNFDAELAFKTFCNEMPKGEKENINLFDVPISEISTFEKVWNVETGNEIIELHIATYGNEQNAKNIAKRGLNRALRENIYTAIAPESDD